MNQLSIKETSYTVRDLVEKSEYQFRILAENKAGFGEPSDSSQTRMAKPPYGMFLTFYPLSVTVTALVYY